MKHLAAAMPQVLWLLLIPALVIMSHMAPPLAAAAASGIASSSSSPACLRRCGNVEIPYPFGIGAECAWPGDEVSFNISCDQSFSPPRPYKGNIEIKNISLEDGEMRVSTPVAYNCYESSDTIASSSVDSWNLTTYLISPTKNVFTVIGCNTLAFLQGRVDWSYLSGCVTSCTSLDAAARDGEPCTGLGCCQTSIAANLRTIKIDWGKDAMNTTFENLAWEYSPCNYAFVAEKGWYNFSRLDLNGTGNQSFSSRVARGEETSSIPLVLDWAIRGNGSCNDGGARACVSAHSQCVNAAHGDGFLCNCSEGYEGNPYIVDGCTDIHECQLLKTDPAKYENKYRCGSGSTCHDIDGGYKCKCKFGLRGDGKSEKGCQPIFPGYAIAILVAFLIFVLASCTILELKRRKKKSFFHKNGGEIVKSMGINVFTEVQLKKITNGYKEPIGEGAFGKVYKGILDSAQWVAVKCWNAKGDVLPKEEFVNEITFQFRMSHANLVRLVGCCLETDVPMLVFEFVPNGSLHNVLHGVSKTRALSLPARLDIAVGSAEALAYMHSHGGHNHVHGDIKSGNILLDDELAPKVSDFGSSKSVANMCSKWCVSGDMSYIDPVYIKSGRFTEKSDVYSFGVVLLELITRKTAKYGENSLPLDFVKSCKDEGNGRKMYDAEILSSDDAQSHHHYMEYLDRIGTLAVRCLKEDVDERPAMAQVVEELKQARVIACGGSCSEAS